MQNIIYTEEYPHDMTFLSYPQETVCFSGHRPNGFSERKVGGFPTEQLIRFVLAGCIELAILDGYRFFMNGLADGVDLWAAEYLLYRKQFHQEEIRLIAVEPCVDYIKNQKSRKGSILKFVWYADALLTVPVKGKYGFLRRNDYMIENSSRLICCIQKENSGTHYTLKKALKNERTIVCLDLRKSNPLLACAYHLIDRNQGLPMTPHACYQYYQTPEGLSFCRSLLCVGR